MSFKVAIQETAHQDIERNALWWADNQSVDEAIKWKAAIYQQLAELETMPTRHPVAVENPAFPFDIREKLVGLGRRPSYRAVFTIFENEVHVLTVRRGAQDAITSDDL
jgi:plasmid stabilization system protein ParE